MSARRRKKTLSERLETQAERTLRAIEKAPEPAAPKDLGTLGRLLERIRSEREASEQEAELRRLNEIAAD